MTGKSPKPSRRPKITPARRHALAKRDGLAWWLWGRTGPMWVYQCPGCKTLIRTGGATGGHIIPRGEGGGDHDGNLRIECLNCNEGENIARLLKGANHTERRIEKAQERRERELLERRGRHKVFSNVPVFWDGRHLSFTSQRRADTFVRDGVAERLPEGGIRLFKAPRSDEPARTDPIDNQCARCGVLKGLSTFHFYPSWHPYRQSLRSSSALPICAICLELFEIAYAIEITRAAGATIQACWTERERIRAEKAVALEIWSRRKAETSLPTDLCRRFRELYHLDPLETTVPDLQRLARGAREHQRRSDRAAFEAIATTVLEHGLDFPALFGRIADGVYQASPADLPKLPVALATADCIVSQSDLSPRTG